MTTLDAAKHELSHVFAAVLPGGQAILFASVTGSRRDAAHIEALSLATRTRRVLIEGTAPLYAPSGHLVFFRDGALLAAPLDADRLELRGRPSASSRLWP